VIDAELFLRKGGVDNRTTLSTPVMGANEGFKTTCPPGNVLRPDSVGLILAHANYRSEVP